MAGLLLYETFVLVFMAGLVLLAWPLAGTRRSGPLAMLVGLALLDPVCLLVPLVLDWRIGAWNWIGKLVSLGVGLAAVRLLGLTRVEIGLLPPRGRRGWIASGAGLAAGLLLTALFVWRFGPNDAPDATTLAYQATLPGIDEELWFRGILMALVARGFPHVRPGGASRVSRRLPGWALPLAITSLHFTAVHVVTIGDGELGLSMRPALFVLPLGLLLGVIRLRSGSLLGGVVTHDAVNVAADLAAFL